MPLGGNIFSFFPSTLLLHHPSRGDASVPLHQPSRGDTFGQLYLLSSLFLQHHPPCGDVLGI
jgi:hypothetical protein